MLRMPLIILRCRSMGVINSLNSKGFKNFGHKKQPLPIVTVLWHGYLTFMFIGLCINWKRYINYRITINMNLIICIYDFSTFLELAVLYLVKKRNNLLQPSNVVNTVCNVKRYILMLILEAAGMI